MGSEMCIRDSGGGGQMGGAAAGGAAMGGAAGPADDMDDEIPF